LKYPGRFSTEAEYGNIILKSNSSGQFIHLKDVADIRISVLTLALAGQG
jgi:HAE1 family hydrophobic/amphiphilic exporter-1